MGQVNPVYYRDVYCEACRKVTLHQLVYEKIDPDSGLILISANCKNILKDVSDRKWDVNVFECWHFECLELTWEQWNALRKSKPFKGEAHKNGRF